MRKTKIICTVGPAAETEEKIEALCRAGMNVARMNFSHNTHEDHKKRIDTVKRVRERLGLPQDKPVILVTGGSQGARNLNSLLIEAAKADPEVHYFVIAGKQDYERVNALAAGAPNINVIGFCCTNMCNIAIISLNLNCFSF